MKRKTWSKLLAVAFLALGAVWAQEDEGPGRGVARLSLLNGDVSVRRGDSGDWIAGAVNTALVVQDHVVTGAASRAEIQFDWANMLRLASSTEVRLAELEYRRYQVQVARGMVTLGVLRESDAEIEVNTPQVSVRPLKRGLYRVVVREDGQTEITVRAGEVEVYTPRGTERLTSGRAMLVRGTASDPEYQVVRAVSEDDWDRWNETRNRQLERTRSYSYVSRHVYGADDLDAYGRWIYDPAYGWVWAPYGVGPTWAPYRHGRWAWIDWYGWSWHSYDPWGWAPFHYGRWYHHASWGWCWWPGYMHHHQYWRPGLVAFFGWGHHSGLHIGIGFGHIGWVPLAPHEPFYPWYGHRYYSGYRNRVYVDNSVNIVNNINITNVYRNARVTNGVSGIEAGEFGRGRAVRAISRSEVDFARAGLVRGAVPVTPRAESLRVSDRNVEAANIPRSTDAGRFYSRRPAASVERVPFEQQRQGVEQMVRRGLGGGAPQTAEAGAGGNLPRTSGGAERGGGERTGAGSLTRGDRQAESGWRRVGEAPRTAEGATQPDTSRGVRVFGEPVTRSGSAEGSRQLERRTEEPTRRSGSAEEGWRRFGSPAGQTERTERTPEAPAREQSGIRRESGEGWSRFGTWRQPERGETSPRTGTPRLEESPSRIERRSGGESRSESPRSSAPSEERTRQGGESIRMSPPIVRERSTPRSESPRSEAPRFESQRYERPQSEAPRYERPRYESPRMESPRYESPRMSSPRYESPRMSSPRFERPSAPSGRMGGGEVRGGGSMPRGQSSSGSMTRSGGGRGRER